MTYGEGGRLLAAVKANRPEVFIGVARGKAFVYGP